MFIVHKKFYKLSSIFLLRVIISLFLTLIISANAYTADHWSVLTSPTSRNLTNCFFINSSTGWISGDSGTIIQTTNGGINWVTQNSGTFNNIEDIFFLNERLGWAVTFEIFPDSTGFPGTRILQTTNGGGTWSNFMFPDTNMFLKTVFYVDSLRGFMGGISATILLTTNAGVSWTKTDTDSTLIFILPIYKIKFLNPLVGYACGGFRDIAGITWVTTNGGLKWDGTVLAPEPFFDITILNSQKTICAGGDLEYGSSIARTVNQGANWYYDTLGVFGLATGISNRTQSEIWMAASYAAKFIFSSDTGNTWTPIETPDGYPILDLDFTDTTYGFACGPNGVILKYDNSSSPVISNEELVSGQTFRLHQNYPNPFNPTTTLYYQITKPGFIKLNIYDVLGNEIVTLVDKEQRQGDYAIKFDAGNLPSGIYFYEIRYNNYSDTKKMVLLK